MLYRSKRPSTVTQSKGEYVIRWIETHCVYTSGKFAGQQVKLLDWEKAFILALFAIDPETGRRWYRWALLGIPKKNGKSELAAWLGLYFLIGDNEPTPWVGVGAGSDNQANLVFGAATRCVQWSPTLSKVVECYDRYLEVPSIPGSRLIRVTSASGTNDGPSWSALVLDELHEWTGDKGRKTWDVLTNGIGAREQPMILQITTAGYDLETVCGEQYLVGKETVRDPEVDPHYLFWWYEPEDDKCDFKDPAVWEEVNPSWGVTLPDPIKYLTDMSVKKTESVFRRYFLNQWVESEDLWLPWGAWDECFDPHRDLDLKLPVYVGVDGALKKDTFAVVLYQRQPVAEEEEQAITRLAEEQGVEIEGRITRDVVRAKIWKNPYPGQHPKRDQWKLNLNEPKNYLREIRSLYPAAAAVDDYKNPIPGPVYGYDPFALELMAIELEDEGLNMLEFPQTDTRMMPASETLYEKILTRVISHDGDEEFRSQIYNCVPKMKDRGWRLARPSGGSRKATDAGIALAMAARLANVMDAPDYDAGPNIW